MSDSPDSRLSSDEATALWDAWLDGSLTEADAHRLTAALRDPVLREAMREQLGIDGALRAMPGLSPEPLVRGFQEELAARGDEGRFVAAFRARQSGAARVVRRPGPRRLVLAAAGGVAMACAAVVLLWRPAVLATLVEAPIGAQVVRDQGALMPRVGMPLLAGDTLIAGDHGLVFDHPDGTWLALAERSRLRIDGPSDGRKRLALDKGAVSSDLTDTVTTGLLSIRTAHALVEGRAADFRVTVDAATRVEVWAGTLTVIALAPSMRVVARAGESIVVAAGQPIQARRPPSLLAARVSPIQHGAVPADVARIARALQADSGTITAAPSPASIPIEWTRLRNVGTGVWSALPEGARQSTPATGYTWDYTQGAVNMGQLPLEVGGSVRLRGRLHVDGVTGKWNVGLFLAFEQPTTAGCIYSARGAHRGTALEFYHHGGPAPGWTTERFPRAPGPLSFDESYWIELEIERPPTGLARARCRLWADGAPRPVEALQGDVEIRGPTAWIGMRTYRTTASFDPVQLSRLPQAVPVARPGGPR